MGTVFAAVTLVIGAYANHFRNAFRHVRANYVVEVSDAQLIDAALGGVDDMDPPPEPGKTDTRALVDNPKCHN